MKVFTQLQNTTRLCGFLGNKRTIDAVVKGRATAVVEAALGAFLRLIKPNQINKKWDNQGW
jgi:hypothetical protein